MWFWSTQSRFEPWYLNKITRNDPQREVTCFGCRVIAGSSPVYATKIVLQHIGVWRHPVTVEIAGSSPVSTAEKWFIGQMAKMSGCRPVRRGFESLIDRQLPSKHKWWCVRLVSGVIWFDSWWRLKYLVGVTGAYIFYTDGEIVRFNHEVQNVGIV